MRAAIMTIFDVPNYGSVLQAFATQEFLEKIGIEPDIINYQYPNEWHLKQRGIHYGIKTKLLKIFRIKSLGLTRSHRKIKKLDLFKKKYFHLTKRFTSYEDLYDADWRKYDLLISGSDQVWNPKFMSADPAYLLQFGGEKKRISFASSFATNNIPSSYIEIYKESLSKYSWISVRERNGAEIINDQLKIDKPVNVILDPTLLLSREDWTRIIPCSLKKHPRNYILLYMLCYAFEPRPYIFEITKYYKEKLGYDVIALEGYSSKSVCGFDMIDATDSSIEDFINLFSNASMVITSSFHGTAFAVNFGIPLISIVPGGGDDRQLSLLESLNLSKCAIKLGQDIRNTDPFYSDCIEQKRLMDIRNISSDYILKSLAK